MGHETIYIEYHGLPLDEEGKPLKGSKPLHVRVGLGTDPDTWGKGADSIYQMDSSENLLRDDGTCRVCRPKNTPSQALRAVETAKPCQGCRLPIQPGQAYYGGAKRPRHIGC